MANRVTMTICGTEYILVAEEDAAYMEKIGGIVDTEKPVGSTAATVRLIPSIVIEPFSTT